MAIKHDIQEKRFYIQEGDQVAELTYEQSDSSSVEFTHTYVPFKLRGKGLAEQLVETGLSWADEQQLTVSTSCWYVEKFLKV